MILQITMEHPVTPTPIDIPREIEENYSYRECSNIHHIGGKLSQLNGDVADGCDVLALKAAP